VKKIYGVLFLTIAVVLSGCNLMQKSGGEMNQGENGKGGMVEEWTGSLKDMVAKNVSMKCSYDDGQGNTWTSYVKGRNYYAEGENDGGKGYILIKDNCMWGWSEGGETQGIKMCFEETEDDDSFWNEPGEYVGSEYHCSPAVVADSKFEVPSGVDFLDMDEMQQMYGGGN